MSRKRIRINLSKRLADHLINAFLIFASVYLAFWMNEKRETRLVTEQSIEAKKAILTELKSNLDILERWAPYHKELLDKGMDLLENIESKGNIGFGEIPGYTKGIMREFITNNGMSLLEGNQVNFDIKTRLLINRIYKQQKYVSKAVSALTDDFMLQRALFDKSKTQENYELFYMLIGELWGQEDAMIRELKFAIKELEK